MQYKDIGLSPEHAQFLGTRQFNVRVVAQWYGVSPAILQDYSDSKFQTVEAQLKHFIMLSVRPWAVRWERAVRRQVIGLDSRFLLEFVMNALLRGDPKTQAETNQIKFMHGALSDDEWRAQDNENPLPGGQGRHYYVPLNLGKIEDVASGQARREQGALPKRDEAGAGESSVQALRSEYRQRAAEEHERTTAAVGELHALRKRTIDDFRRVVAKDAARMIRHEVTAVTRLAGSSPRTFLTEIDRFYERFEAKLCEAIRPAVEGCMAAQGLTSVTTAPFALAAARNHVAESRRRLLAAAECQLEELADRVTACVSAWDERTIDIDQFKAAA
jgi:hypothetical protein